MKMRILLTMLLCLVACGGCRTTNSIYEVRDTMIVSNLSHPSKEDVRKAILRAGASLGWQLKENGPDALIGTLMLRSHVAVVDIPYSASSYSITYKSSTNLNYTGTSIHSNYNGWIQNLHRAINVQLGAL